MSFFSAAFPLPRAGETYTHTRQTIGAGRGEAEEVHAVLGTGFELYATDALWTALSLHHDPPSVRHELAQVINDILAGYSKGADLDNPQAEVLSRRGRHIRAIAGPLADMLPNTQLAIKGTTGYTVGGNFSNPISKLSKQFHASREARRRQETRAADGIGGLITINNVHGLVRYADARGRIREWLIMERIDGPPVGNLEARPGSAMYLAGFLEEAHPQLAALVPDRATDTHNNIEYIPFSGLERVMHHALGYDQGSGMYTPFNDVHGQNLLVQQGPENPRYTVIDIESGFTAR